jgi:predicted ATPase/class 3 adenylate cyclase
VHDPSAVTTYLFTDIEGSTGHWEREPQRMQAALAQHDAIAHACVTADGGTVVKTTGDGIHAVFADPLGAVRAAVALQLALADAGATGGIALRVRCGLHAGVDARRDNDYYGNAVNRAARVMSAAHGGQILVSQAVAALVAGRLPKDIALLDLGQVHLRGLAQPEQVCQVVHPSLQRQFPALRSLAETPNNLPQQLTSFVARERERTEVARQLGETRLLTLLGGGGFGKTRLSLQVAADVLDGYPDGVWLVELAPVGDPRLVPQAVATALGVKEVPGFPVQDALRKFARERRFLLVLDNCEHVVHACAELARQLLEAASGVTILASSREPLNIRGERTYPLAPLTAPAPAPALRADAIAEFSAVQLFAERAAAAQPSFHVTDDNARAVAEICHQLDGIPLALELAAARLRSMPVERIAERLSDRFRLLTSGDRTALPRQQTLRALIDWSYDLLDERERMLFRRLAVFAGGFTLDAAEKVGADGDVGYADVLDLLARLVDKSLVTLDAAGERYRMLETVRQYADERLGKSGEMPATKTRHLMFFLALAEKARPELVGPNQREWLATLDAERENIIAAHAWCDHADDGGQLGLRLVLVVRTYCLNRGLLAMGLGATVEALARPGAQARNIARCRGLFQLGQIELVMGHYAEALAPLEESLSIAREIGDRGRVAAVLQPLGMALVALGNTVKAGACLEEALLLARELGDRREIAAALTALAQLYRLRGEMESTEPLYDEVLALSRELGDRASIAIGLLNLAIVAINRGAAGRAGEMLREAIAIALEVGSRPIGQSALEVAAGLAVLEQRWDRAARLIGAADSAAAQSGLQRDAADAKFLLPLIERARATMGEASYAAARQAGGALEYDSALAEARAGLPSAATA